MCHSIGGNPEKLKRGRAKPIAPKTLRCGAFVLADKSIEHEAHREFEVPERAWPVAMMRQT